MQITPQNELYCGGSLLEIHLPTRLPWENSLAVPNPAYHMSCMWSCHWKGCLKHQVGMLAALCWWGPERPKRPSMAAIWPGEVVIRMRDLLATAVYCGICERSEWSVVTHLTRMDANLIKRRNFLHKIRIQFTYHLPTYSPITYSDHLYLNRRGKYSNDAAQQGRTETMYLGVSARTTFMSTKTPLQSNFALS